jgi:hypothetical protein
MKQGGEGRPEGFMEKQTLGLKSPGWASFGLVFLIVALAVGVGAIKSARLAKLAMRPHQESIL